MQIVLEDTEIRAIHHVNMPSVDEVVCPDVQEDEAFRGTHRIKGMVRAAGMTAHATRRMDSQEAATVRSASSGVVGVRWRQVRCLGSLPADQGDDR